MAPFFVRRRVIDILSVAALMGVALHSESRQALHLVILGPLVAAFLNPTDRYRQYISDAVRAVTSSRSPNLWTASRELDEETLRSAFVRLSNLMSPAYRRFFLSQWDEQNPLRAILILASGVRSPPIPMKTQIRIETSPLLIQNEIPVHLMQRLRTLTFMRTVDPTKFIFLTFEWQYAILPNGSGFWMPKELLVFSKLKTWTPRYFRMLTAPLRPKQGAEHLDVLDVVVQTLHPWYLQSMAKGQETALWVFGALPPSGFMDLPGPFLGSLPGRASELYLSKIDLSGKSVSLDWPGSLNIADLKAAVAKDPKPQITPAQREEWSLLAEFFPMLAAKAPGEKLWGPRLYDPTKAKRAPALFIGGHAALADYLAHKPFSPNSAQAMKDLQRSLRTLYNWGFKAPRSKVPSAPSTPDPKPGRLENSNKKKPR